MDALVALTAAHLETFVLVFCRLGGMMVWAPVLGDRSIPVPHRAGLAALLGLLITPVVGGAPRGSAGDAVALVGAVAGEVIVGLAIGFVASLILAAVHVAGEMAGMQMGLGLASVFDPAAGEQTQVLTRLLEIAALLTFLAVNGHHLLIRAVAASFSRIGLGAALDPAAAGGLGALGGKVFRSGLEMAAPVVGLLMALNVALALLSRAVPQMNVFFVALPASVAVGLLGLVDSMPVLGHVVTRLVGEMAGDLDLLFRGVSHGAR